jgi:hypothetical protein
VTDRATLDGDLGVLLLLEQPLFSGQRRFVVDCPHARTVLILEDWPHHDAARADGMWAKLIRQHRAAIWQTERVACACTARSSVRA